MKDILKLLITKKIIDYRALVLAFYHRLELTEQEAIALIRLNSLLDDKQEIIKPAKFSKWLSLSVKETEQLLESLMNKGYLQIKLIETSNGKEKEVFDIDFFLLKVIDLLEKTQRKTYQNYLSEVLVYLEDTLQSTLSPLDAELVSDWVLKESYPFEMIKDATLKALKSNYPSIRRIDQILLNETKAIPIKPQKKDVLKEFHKLWDE